MSIQNVNTRSTRVQDLFGWMLDVYYYLTEFLSASSESVKITPDGGIAVKFKNRTGAVSVKGYVVTASSSYDNSVSLIVVDAPNPIGVIYESGIPDGGDVWVVVSGKAHIYFVGNTTRGNFARGFLSSDVGYVSGQALSEAYPTSPFASDKHFYEIGHVLESRTGAGLALTVLHFN